MTLALTSLAATTAAHAQSDDRAIALGLFEQGRKLRAEGKDAEATSKFEGAAKLMRTYGILLNLAECYEKLGRLASAWSTWREAEYVARSQRNADDERRAAERVRDLEPRLSHLTIAVPEQDEPPELSITSNGITVPRAAWSTALPVDPGPQIVEVRAPGYQTWKTLITLRETGDKQVVTVPRLERDLANPSGSDAKPSGMVTVGTKHHRSSSATRSEWPAWLGPTVGGAGIVTAAVGALIWRGGQSKIDAALTQGSLAIDNLDRARYDAAADDLSSGKSQRTAGVVTTCVGAALSITGVAIILVRPNSVEATTTRAQRYGAWFDGRNGGVRFATTF